MKKTLFIACLVLMLAHVASAENVNETRNTISVLKVKTFYVGDERRLSWAHADYLGLNMSVRFYVEVMPKKAYLKMKLFEVDLNNNPVYLNGRLVGYICPIGRGSWKDCEIPVDTSLIRKGWNNLSIHAVSGPLNPLMAGKEDMLVDNLNLYVVYYSIESILFVEKHQTLYEVMQGDELNVSVIVHNIGLRPVYNLSITDFKPPGAFLKYGSLTKELYDLPGGAIMRYQYTLVPDVLGPSKSYPGLVSYHNTTGHLLNSTFDQTILDVLPAKPMVFVYKNFRESDEKTVELTVINIGERRAYHVNLSDEVPVSYKLVSGTAKTYFGTLEPGEMRTINYTLSPVGDKAYSISATLAFEDEAANKYSRLSEPLTFEPVARITPETGSRNQVIAVALIIALIILLAYVYTRVKN